MHILHCHTQGGEIGRQFSAFNAKLACGQTIERIYQEAKRDREGNPYLKGFEKGKIAYSLHICGENRALWIPENARTRCQWYTMLWQTWFFENPYMWATACIYEGFVDKYDGASGKLYCPGDDYQPENGRCAQSASIAYLVGHDNAIEDLLPIVERSFEKYWGKFHPNVLMAILP